MSIVIGCVQHPCRSFGARGRQLVLVTTSPLSYFDTAPYVTVRRKHVHTTRPYVCTMVMVMYCIIHVIVIYEFFRFSYFYIVHYQYGHPGTTTHGDRSWQRLFVFREKMIIHGGKIYGAYRIYGLNNIRLQCTRRERRPDSRGIISCLGKSPIPR